MFFLSMKFDIMIISNDHYYLVTTLIRVDIDIQLPFYVKEGSLNVRRLYHI